MLSIMKCKECEEVVPITQDSGLCDVCVTEQLGDNAMEQFLNTPEDCKWLRDTHLRYFNDDEVPDFKSFYICGNEDYPDGILLYARENPDHDDKPILRLWEAEDKGYRELDPDETFPPA